MNEILSQVWTYIASILSGVTLAGIISAVICGVVKGGFNKTINKLNVEEITEKATQKGIEQVQTITFKHSIEPLVKSELVKVYEETTTRLTEQVKQMESNYNNIINVLEKFSAYFENSLVSDETKKELKQAIESAKINDLAVESAVVVNSVDETKKTETSGKKSTRKTTIQR